jgi:hypothetical protein
MFDVSFRGWSVMVVSVNSDVRPNGRAPLEIGSLLAFHANSIAEHGADALIMVNTVHCFAQ